MSKRKRASEINAEKMQTLRMQENLKRFAALDGFKGKNDIYNSIMEKTDANNDALPLAYWKNEYQRARRINRELLGFILQEILPTANKRFYEIDKMESVPIRERTYIGSLFFDIEYKVKEFLFSLLENK